MNFIDECSVMVRAGDGGHGCVAFRRERNHPRGGPSGGDGGHGGSVIFVADPQLSTLQDLAYQHEYRAESGQGGQGRDRYGQGGADRLVPVPVGTVVRDGDSQGAVLADLGEAGTRFVAARGGKGGRGNIHFATSTNQAPHRAEPGEKGEERRLNLELKLLADVGLLGYPNVGKSTLIARVSQARPKIADYPFTTLVPQLGVVRLPFGARAPDRSLVVADIPGLIEGAHLGHGLGLKFLRHLQRTRLLIHLLEVSDDPQRDPLRDHDTINEELQSYDPELARRPQLVVLSKLDLTETRQHLPALREAFAKRGIPLHAISAVTGEGLSPLLEAAYAGVKAARDLSDVQAGPEAGHRAEGGDRTPPLPTSP